MATIDLTGRVSQTVVGGCVKLVNVVDFDDAEASKGSLLAAADVISLFNLPVGFCVNRVYIKSFRAGVGTTLDLDVGITGGDTDGWIDGNDGKDAAGEVNGSGANGALVVAGGTLYTTASVMACLINTYTGVTTNPKYAFIVEGFDASQV